MTVRANERHEDMRGMTALEAWTYVKGVVEGATIVFGVFQDLAAANGVDMHIIKGKRELQVCIASGEPLQARVDAIPCICLEQAIAAEQVIGDGQLRGNS